MSRHEPRCPSGLKIEATSDAIDIKHLACEK